MYIDNVKILTRKKNEKKNEKMLNKIQTTRISNQAVEMEFSIEECAMISRKREITEGTEIPNREIIKIIGEKENYLYLEWTKII